jgi:hypothetical protein
VTDQDPHSPTSAGPEPALEQGPGTAPAPEPEPTPVVGASEATWSHPPGSAAPAGGFAGEPAVDPHPEKKVGAAFAGGLVGAVFLKILANRKHR